MFLGLGGNRSVWLGEMGMRPKAWGNPVGTQGAGSTGYVGGSEESLESTKTPNT